jgi:hypothetical protein
VGVPLPSQTEVGERDIRQVVSRVAAVSGATRNLGLALGEVRGRTPLLAIPNGQAAVP